MSAGDCCGETALLHGTASKGRIRRRPPPFPGEDQGVLGYPIRSWGQRGDSRTRMTQTERTGA